MLEGYAKHMKKLVEKWSAGTLVLDYGFYESLGGEKGLESFKEQYRTHLSQLEHTHPGAKVVMLSPIVSEDASAERNADLQLYTNAIEKLAKEFNAQYIDIFTPIKKAYAASEPKLTDREIYLNKAGNSLVAKVIAEKIAGAGSPSPENLYEVALAAAAKHLRVAEIVCPQNTVVYFGIRERKDEYRKEVSRYHKMVELTVAKDYEVNLVASEEDFPELRNPVQIAFDAKGRLWVVTMPSFPHTVPGLTLPDKILILEDTDKE